MSGCLGEPQIFLDQLRVFRQLEQHCVHHVVGVEVGVTDKEGGIANLGDQVGDASRQLVMACMAFLFSQVGSIGFQCLPLRLQVSHLCCAHLERGPIFCLDRLELLEVCVYEGLGCLEFSE